MAHHHSYHSMKVYRTYFPYAHLIGEQASPGLERGITTSERKRGLWFSLVFLKKVGVWS